MAAGSDARRAAVILIQRGDAELSGAIARGLLEGKAGRVEPGERLEAVCVEASDAVKLARLVKVAVGNDKTPEDYRIMLTKARALYGTGGEHSPLRAVTGRLLLGWARICLEVRRAYRAQDKVLRRG